VIAHAAQPSLPADPVAAVRTVAITDLAVTPAALVVAPGTEVMWHNDGRNRHTVTADDDLFASRILFTGDEFTISAPATPGVHAYHCLYHSYIRGTLTVSLVALNEPEPVEAGRPVMLGGTVPGAAAGSPVRVERRVPGAWVVVGEATTDASGAFSVTAPPVAARTAFRALAAGTLSPSVRVEVRPVVGVRRAGRRLVARVRPALPGAAVRLARLDLDTYRWAAVATRRLSGRQARFTLRAPGVYRAEVDARGGLSAASSRSVEFRSGAFRQ
jgi:plastocyanin